MKFYSLTLYLLFKIYQLVHMLYIYQICNILHPSGKMYWTDTILDKISRADLNGSNVETVIEHGIHTADGLAVDSIGKKIYWTDDGHNLIQVANLDGSMRSVLIHERHDKPRAIALHYEKG